MDRNEVQEAGGRARDRLLDRLPVAARRVDVDGLGTTVLEGGQGPPIVLLHGATAPGGLVWWRVLPGLLDDHRVIVPDLPGFGASDRVDRLDAATVADWLARLIALTCPEPPTLVAHSNPGSLAARAAAGHGELLGRLVLVAVPGVGRWRPPSPVFVADALRMSVLPSERSVNRFEEGWCYRDLDRIRNEDADGNEAFETYLLSCAVRPETKRALRQIIRAGTQRIPDADLRGITVPTRLLWGSHDRLVARQIGEDAAARLGWPLHTVDDAGHLPHVDRPTAFVDTLGAALDPTRG